MAALGVGAWGVLVAHSLFFGLAGTVLVLAATAEFLLPSEFEVAASSARARSGLSRSEIEWSEVRRIATDGRGLLLTPLPRASRLDRFRGVYLRFDGNEEAVRQAVREARAAAIAGEAPDVGPR
jgi:hypothetical protein